MPLDSPSVDKRRFQDFLNETLARIPVHTPEWTNYGPSDPGRTVIELFSFLAENMAYMANQVPDRNRRKFLQLLGVPLRAGSPARGIVTFNNKSGPLETITLNADLEIRAGQVPFQTEHALDVLPVEGRVYYKRRIVEPKPGVEEYYRLLYASYKGSTPPESFKLNLYETMPLELLEPHGIDLGQDAIDASVWIALLAPPGRDPVEIRKTIQGKTLSLGIVPAMQDVTRALSPAGNANTEGESLLRFELPALPQGGKLSEDPQQRVAQYRTIDPRPLDNVNALVNPGVVEITLPSAAELELWQNLDPLESGANNFPPMLDDTNLESRIITWLRISAPTGMHIRLLWIGINATTVEQRDRIPNEVLQAGTGLPDQVRQLARKPVLRGSVKLRVTTGGGKPEDWLEVDDLIAAGSEVDTPDLLLPPGAPPLKPRRADVFVVDHEAGTIRFGDGFRGKRPPEGASLVATYDYSQGAAGNVEKASINTAPALPAGFTVANPVRTWGGADPETVTQGEKQIARYLQHRERLVTVEDFQSIARRAPGVQIGRLEVLPAFHPLLSVNEPGDAPGVVTLMVIPSYDRQHPDAPQPDSFFLNALCRYLDPRRLVTTEVLLYGPTYVPIYISVGVDIKAGHAVAEVREAVKRRLLDFLAPLYPKSDDTAEQGPDAWRDQGWPLRKAVLDRELMAEASRVDGVLLVNDVRLAEGSGNPVAQIAMTGLQLPHVVGISVQIGTPMSLDALRGQPTDTDTAPPATRIVPVPLIPEEC